MHRTDRNAADRCPHHAIHKIKVNLRLQFLIGHGAVSNTDLSQIREVCIHAVFLLAKCVDGLFCLSHGFGFFCRLCFLLRYLFRFCVFLLVILFLYHRIRMSRIKEPAQVGFADMVRESAHRQSLAVCKSARSQGQSQRLCRCFGVLAEKLVKVSDANHSEVIRILGFDLSVGAQKSILRGRFLFRLRLRFCRVSCHQGLINAVGSLTLPNCRQQFLNLPSAGVKAVQIPVRIAVAAHGNQIILPDKSLQSADKTEDGRNHAPFQHSHRNPCRLLRTPQVGWIGAVNLQRMPRRLPDGVRFCHIIVRHLARFLPFQNGGAHTLSAQFCQNPSVGNNPSLHEIHIDAVCPGRIGTAVFQKVIPSGIVPLQFCREGFDRRFLRAAFSASPG